MSSEVNATGMQPAHSDGGFVAVAMVYDPMKRGRIHPAHFWGFGTVTLAVAIMRPLAFSPPMLALTAALTR